MRRILSRLDERGLRVDVAGRGLLVDEAELLAREIVERGEAAALFRDDVARVARLMVDLRRHERLELRLLRRGDVGERREPADIREAIFKRLAERLVVRDDDRARLLPRARGNILEDGDISFLDGLRRRERIDREDNLIRLFELHGRALHLFRHVQQRLRVAVDLLEVAALPLDARRRLLRIARDGDGRLTDVLDDARHLIRRLALAVRHLRELIHDLLEMTDVTREPLHRGGGVVRLPLDSAELLTARAHPLCDGRRLRRDLPDDLLDLLRRLVTLVRELADLARDDGETAPVLPRARRLDGGVECEQVRLRGDTADLADERLDLLRGRIELVDLLDALLHGARDRLDVLADLRDDLLAAARDLRRALALRETRGRNVGDLAR